MTGPIANRSIPAAIVIPELAYPDVVEATDWLCKAFGFIVRLRIGNHRAQLVYGEGAVIVMEGGSRDVAPQFVLVRVEDADAHHEHALAAGARIVTPPTDYPYGERQYNAEDLGGHRWTFSQSTADVDPAEWGGVLVSEVDVSCRPSRGDSHGVHTRLDRRHLGNRHGGRPGASDQQDRRA